MQLTAFEKTYWTESHSYSVGDHTETRTEHHGATAEFLNVQQSLSGGHRELTPGQYQWQIVFGLPPGLPSSFRVGTGGDG